MGKIIRLTEADLTRLVSKVIKEQSKVMMDKVASSSSSSTKPKVMTNKVVSSSKKYNIIDTCASMGVKSPGDCDTEGKKPVKWCASMGVKTPGYCYVDSKKPIPNQIPHSKDSVKEQKSRRPLLNESPVQMQANQMAQDLLDQVKSGEATPDPSLKQSIVDCIKKGSYRHLSVLTLGAGTEILGALALLFASGVGTLPAMLMVFTGAAIVTIEGLLTGKDSGAGGVGDEIKQLQACLKSSGKIK